MSHENKLVYMANQIGGFFITQHRRDEAKAVEDIATHIRKFWDPRMRRQIVAQLQAGEADALDPLPRRAIERLAAIDTPPAGR